LRAISDVTSCAVSSGVSTTEPSGSTKQELWYIRGYAADQLEPMAMHQVFARADWPKAFVDHLELSGFAFVSLLDGSTLSQITASYYLSDAWTATLSFAGNVGSPRSERGSIPQIANGIAEIIRYF